MSIIIVCITAALFSYVLSRYYKNQWKKHLKVEVAFEQEHCTEGDTGRIEEVVWNEKWLPLASLVIKFPIDRSIRYKELENTNVSDQQYRTDCILARPYEKITRSFAVTFLKRGYYTIPKVDLVAADFFYSSIFAEQRENESEVYVYPSNTSCRQVSYAVNKLMGEYMTNRFLYEDPFAFKGIREYVPTDSMRKVNWKASAKTDALMVNQHYDRNQPSLRIFLDVETEGMQEQEELEEELIRIASSYLKACKAKGIPAELITNGTDVCTKEEIRANGKTSMEGCLKKLARLTTKEISRPFQELLEPERRGEKEVSVLLSICQDSHLLAAYEKYVRADGVGQWLILGKLGMERKVTSRHIHIIYGEVE